MLELFDLEADPYERVNLAEDPAHNHQLNQLQTWARELALQMVGIFLRIFVQGTFSSGGEDPCKDLCSGN